MLRNRLGGDGWWRLCGTHRWLWVRPWMLPTTSPGQPERWGQASRTGICQRPGTGPSWRKGWARPPRRMILKNQCVANMSPGRRDSPAGRGRRGGCPWSASPRRGSLPRGPRRGGITGTPPWRLKQNKPPNPWGHPFGKYSHTWKLISLASVWSSSTTTVVGPWLEYEFFPHPTWSEWTNDQATNRIKHSYLRCNLP